MQIPQPNSLKPLSVITISTSSGKKTNIALPKPAEEKLPDTRPKIPTPPPVEIASVAAPSSEATPSQASEELSTLPHTEPEPTAPLLPEVPTKTFTPPSSTEATQAITVTPVPTDLKPLSKPKSNTSLPKEEQKNSKWLKDTLAAIKEGQKNINSDIAPTDKDLHDLYFILLFNPKSYTIGKLIINCENLTSKGIPSLARIITASKESAVLNNLSETNKELLQKNLKKLAEEFQSSHEKQRDKKASEQEISLPSEAIHTQPTAYSLPPDYYYPSQYYPMPESFSAPAYYPVPAYYPAPETIQQYATPQPEAYTLPVAYPGYSEYYGPKQYYPIPKDPAQPYYPLPHATQQYAAPQPATYYPTGGGYNPGFWSSPMLRQSIPPGAVTYPETETQEYYQDETSTYGNSSSRQS